ncbi:MAG: hypothetical protein IPJ71_15725 [Bdellovibrionales bacterium]|nr:hypothetical protein [Bdellovibrionales bacterium]
MKVLFVTLFMFAHADSAKNCTYNNDVMVSCYDSISECKKHENATLRCRAKFFTINDLPKPNKGTCLWVKEGDKWKNITCTDLAEGCKAQQKSFPSNIVSECR